MSSTPTGTRTEMQSPSRSNPDGRPVSSAAGRQGLERLRSKFFSSKSNSLYNQRRKINTKDIIVDVPVPDDPPLRNISPPSSPTDIDEDESHSFFSDQTLCNSPQEQDSRPPTPSSSYEIKAARRKQTILDGRTIQTALIASPSFGNFNVAYSPGVTRSFSQREPRYEYRRQALHSSLKRMNSAPVSRTTTLSTTPTPFARSNFQEQISESQTQRTAPTHQLSIPSSCILAIDPGWDPSKGDATVYVFPQDETDEGRDVVTPEEILEGFFPDSQREGGRDLHVR